MIEHGGRSEVLEAAELMRRVRRHVRSHEAQSDAAAVEEPTAGSPQDLALEQAVLIEGLIQVVGSLLDRVVRLEQMSAPSSALSLMERKVVEGHR